MRWPQMPPMCPLCAQRNVLEASEKAAAFAKPRLAAAGEALKAGWQLLLGRARHAWESDAVRLDAMGRVAGLSVCLSVCLSVTGAQGGEAERDGLSSRSV
jgi:hypothetical protein